MAPDDDRLLSEQRARVRIDGMLEDTDNLPPARSPRRRGRQDFEVALAEFTELAESLQDIGVEVEEP